MTDESSMATVFRVHTYLLAFLTVFVISRVTIANSESGGLQHLLTTLNDAQSKLQSPRLDGEFCAADPQPSRERIISDDLVQDLPCAGLTQENVLRFIPKEKLIAKADLIGSVETNFAAPGMKGQCWAITRAQRIAIFLTTVTPKPPAKDAAEAMNELRQLAKTRETFLNTARGSILDRDCNAYFVTPDSACEAAQKLERPMPLGMIELPTLKSIEDLMKVSRRLMPSNAEWISPRHLTATDWLARNGHLFPQMTKRLRAESVVDEAEDRERDLIFARMGQEFSKTDLAVLAGVLSKEAGERRNKEILEGLLRRMNRLSKMTKDSLLVISNGEKLESEIPNVPSAPETGERQLASDVAQAQLKLFFRPRNLRFLGGNRERSTATNIQTVGEIERAIDNGRMPMLNLRFKLTAQHVVTAFSHKKLSDGTIEFEVFDSNSDYPRDEKLVIDHDGERVKVTKRTGEPPRRMKLHYKDGKFTYPDEKAVEKFGAEPIGVFITDEPEMDEIQKIVFEHYHRLCQLK